jgi:hypothetical protein
MKQLTIKERYGLEHALPGEEHVDENRSIHWLGDGPILAP